MAKITVHHLCCCSDVTGKDAVKETTILLLLVNPSLEQTTYNPYIYLTRLYRHKRTIGEGEARDVWCPGTLRVPLLQVLGQNRSLYHFHGQPQVHHGEKPAVLDTQGDRSVVQYRLIWLINCLIRTSDHMHDAWLSGVHLSRVGSE